MKLIRPSFHPLISQSARNVTGVAVKKKAATKKAKKYVRFDEESNTYHACTYSVSADENKDIWYNRDEVIAFSKEWNDHFFNLHAKKNEDTGIQAWFSYLEQAFESFCTMRSTQELEKMLDTTPMNVFYLESHGMEKLAIPFVVKETLARRRCIYAAVQECQEHPLFLRKRQMERIRQACRVWSLASTVYARHVALISAEH